MLRYKPSLGKDLAELRQQITILRQSYGIHFPRSELIPVIERIDVLVLSVTETDLALVKSVNRSYINLIMIIIALFALMASFAFVYRAASRRSLQRERSTIEYSRATVAAQENERRKIARDLHDTIIQDIASIKLDTENLYFDAKTRTEALNALFERLIQRERNCLDNLRNICFDLRPPELDYLNLNAAIAHICSDFEARTGIHCTFSADHDMEFDETTAINLYRIIQESLANAARHSSATTVSIASRRNEKNGLTISISDNGIGITEPLPAVSGGSLPKKFGIRGMNERANAIGGTLTIDATDGIGVRVTVSVPVRWKNAIQRKPRTTEKTIEY